MANDEFSKEVITTLKEIKSEFIQCDKDLVYYDKKFIDDKFRDSFEPILIKLFNYIFDKKYLRTEFLNRIDFINKNAKTITKLSKNDVIIKNGELFQAIAYPLPMNITDIYKATSQISSSDKTIKKLLSKYSTLFIKDFIDTYCLYCFYAKSKNYLDENHATILNKISNYYNSSWLFINKFKDFKDIPTTQVIRVIDELVRFVDNNSKPEKMRNKHVFHYSDDSRSGIKSLSINGEKLNIANAEISDFFDLYQTNSLKRTNSVAKNLSKVRSAIKEKIGRDIIKCKKGYYSLNKENLTFAGFDK